MFNDDDGLLFALYLSLSLLSKRDLHNFLTSMNKADDPEHQQQQTSK